LVIDEPPDAFGDLLGSSPIFIFVAKSVEQFWSVLGTQIEELFDSPPTISPLE
jgi:hypothetical protein